MRLVLTVVVAVCLTLGLTGGVSCTAPSIQSCLRDCGLCSSHRAAGGDRTPSSTCSVNCPLCASPSALILPASDFVRVQLSSDRQALEPDWEGATRTYPPPLPPPRLSA